MTELRTAADIADADLDGDALVPITSKTAGAGLFRVKLSKLKAFFMAGGGGAGVPDGGTTGQVLTKLSDDDGDADWQDASGGGGGGGSAYPTAAYWRVRAFVSRSNAFCAIALEMRSSVGGANIATGGTAISSNEEFGDDANAFDGDAGTFWGTANTDGRWIGYHFANAVSVKEVVWTARTGSEAAQVPTHIAVDYSNDGVLWKAAFVAILPVFASGGSQAASSFPAGGGSGGGSGGGDWAFNPPLAADVTGFSGDGTAVVLTDDPDIGLIIDNGGNNNDGPYRGITVPIPASGAHQFTVRFNYTGSSPSYTAPAFGVLGDGNTRGRALWFYKNSNLYNLVRWRQGIAGQNGGNDGDISFQNPLDRPTWIQVRILADNTIQWFRSGNGKTWTLMFASDGNTTGRPDKFMAAIRIASGDGLHSYLVIDHLVVEPVV